MINFLSTHLRARRPYKKMVPLQSQQLQQQQQQEQGLQQRDQQNSINTLRSPDTAETPNKKRSYQCTQAACSTEESSQTTPYQIQPSVSLRELRCAAFGNFVASSLRDFTQNAALELIGQLTSELVKSLLEKSKDSNDSPSD
uniref:Uncharacterized protein n=1 Tax=Glossina austeni TaxID=7395 RepID=A0A1A9UF18_GLOAU